MPLFQHLESAPKDILGDFPRFTREAAAAIVFKTEAKHKGWDNLDDDMPDHMRNQVKCLMTLLFITTTLKVPILLFLANFQRKTGYSAF
jgi:hypothetical protein